MATYPYITFSCLGLRYYGWWASPPVAPSNGTSSRFLRSTMCCCYQASTKTCQSPATMVVAFLPGSNGPSVCIITCGGAVRRRRRRRKHNCTRRRRSSNNNNNIMENAWHRWHCTRRIWLPWELVAEAVQWNAQRDDLCTHVFFVVRANQGCP